MTCPTRTFVNGWVRSVCCFGHCQLDCAKLQHVHLFRALDKESDGMRGTKLMIYGLIFDGDDDSNDSFCYSYSYYVLLLDIYCCRHRNANESCDTGFFTKNSHPMKYHTTEVMSTPSPNSMSSSEFCVWRSSKKHSHFCWWCSTLQITTSRYLFFVSCGWLCFLKNPVWHCYPLVI